MNDHTIEEDLIYLESWAGAHAGDRPQLCATIRRVLHYIAREPLRGEEAQHPPALSESTGLKLVAAIERLTETFTREKP